MAKELSDVNLILELDKCTENNFKMSVLQIRR